MFHDTLSLVAGHDRANVLTPDGELLSIQGAAVSALLRSSGPPLLIHAPATFRRMGARPAPALDLLELFAFVLPARPVPPTARGLALALDMDPPGTPEDAVVQLAELARAMLRRLAAGRDLARNRGAAGLAARMAASGWLWAPYVLAALDHPDARPSADAFRVWRHLPEWEEHAPLPPPGSHPVPPSEARRRLARMLGPHAEQRPGQADYADGATAAFAPREASGGPRVVLAEAGTGTGKTLGYVAPATLWAERNGAPVWISTYTRHLQRQVEAELARLYPEPADRRRRVVVRKGRENYLCLLNMEEQIGLALSGVAPRMIVPLGLIARWAMATGDGDITGGDFPGWFGELFGAGATLGLADRRGECIHGACPHYRTCFVEHTIRRARGAELVVANHALVMAQAAWGGLDDVPTRYVFDEGHHVFDAADSAFSAELSGIETAELRRWLLGAEGGRSRARGLRRRLEDLVANRPALEAPLDAALTAARVLPPPGWSGRLGDESLPGMNDATDGEGAEPRPANPAEAFLHLLRRQVLARAPGDGAAGSRQDLQCELHPVAPGLPAAAQRLTRALGRIAEPLAILERRLGAMLEDEARELDSAVRARIEAARRSLKRRALNRLSAWEAMLQAVSDPPPAPGERPDHVHFLRLDRRDAHEGGDRNVGLHRHWLDPTVPFAGVLAAPAHGILVTSATLRDTGQLAAENAWAEAEARVGVNHLPLPALRVSVASPFDYAAQARAFVVTDVGPETEAVAGAMRALFCAAGGGGLGLFTAIHRLVAVHRRLAPELEKGGLLLLAQHVDAMDNATLVDVFRTEIDSCLLGTDAMRDGVDVPGRALRLVAFDRVPWPRPDILHRERRIHLSDGRPKEYDDRLARLRLRQAFGRLVRTGADRGVFVLLDRRTPSRLLSAFPPGVAVQRVGIAQAAAEAGAFLSASSTSAE